MSCISPAGRGKGGGDYILAPTQFDFVTDRVVDAIKQVYHYNLCFDWIAVFFFEHNTD